MEIKIPTRDERRLRHLGLWLRAARENLRYSYRELAKLSGVSASQLLRMEAGLEISLSRFLKVVEALGISPGILLEAIMFNSPPRLSMSNISEKPFVAFCKRAGFSEDKRLDYALQIRHFIMAVAEMTGALILSSNPDQFRFYIPHDFEKINERLFAYVEANDLSSWKHYERLPVLESLFLDPYSKLSSLKIIDDDLLQEYCEWIEGFPPYEKDWSYTTTWAAFHIGKPGQTYKKMQEDAEDARKRLTESSVFRNISSDMKLSLKAILNDVRRLTKATGGKTQLAKDLGVPKARVSEWLAGKYEPSGEMAIALFNWVQEQK
jgi:transcriptional regulator with XRE-family HTH domain